MSDMQTVELQQPQSTNEQMTAVQQPTQNQARDVSSLIIENHPPPYLSNPLQTQLPHSQSHPTDKAIHRTPTPKPNSNNPVSVCAEEV